MSLLAGLASLIAYFRIAQWRLQAVLEERERLAHEMHDTIAQSSSASEHANADGGKTVFLTWIPKDLKTHPGSVITSNESDCNWRVARQYTQTMQDNAIEDVWKIVEQSPEDTKKLQGSYFH